MRIVLPLVFVAAGALLTQGCAFSRGTLGDDIKTEAVSLIKNGVSLFNVPVEMQYILIGVLLLANVALNRWRRGR